MPRVSDPHDRHRVIAQHGHQPLVDLRLQEHVERIKRRRRAGGGGGGFTGAARVIAGIFASGAPINRGEHVVRRGIQTGGEPHEQNADDGRAPAAPITHVGTTAARRSVWRLARLASAATARGPPPAAGA